MTQSRGFTLIEMLVVVTIISVLASAAFPLAELTIRREREQELRIALRQLRIGIDAYKQAYDEGRMLKRVGASGYPRKLEELVEGIEDAKNPLKAKIYFLRRLPRDPTYPDATVSAAATWGQRSYASPPDDPRSGDDVFDVYSRSPQLGLNGIPYREW